MTYDPSMATMAVAGSAMRAQALRVRLASENLANADSKGYERRTVQFEVSNPDDDMRDIDFVAIGRIGRDHSELTRTYDPTNPMAEADGYVTKSNVNSIIEMGNAREANHSYEASLNMFEQARSMYSQMLDLLRR